MSMSLATQYPTIGTLQLSAETKCLIDLYAIELAAFADVEEIDDTNFDRANKALAQATRLNKAIKAEAKAQTDELKSFARSIDVDVDRHLAGIDDPLKPLTAKVAVYTTRKEQIRKAALAEKQRLEAEQRARRAAEANRIAAEKEAKAAANREAFRVEQERRAAAEQGEPVPPAFLRPPVELPPPLIQPHFAANTVAPLPPVADSQIVAADLGRVIPRPVVHVPARVQSAVRTRTTFKLVITDEASIPMFAPNGTRLWKIDEVALRAALKAGEVIPGAQLVEESTSFAVGG